MVSPNESNQFLINPSSPTPKKGGPIPKNKFFNPTIRNNKEPFFPQKIGFGVKFLPKKLEKPFNWGS